MIFDLDSTHSDTSGNQEKSDYNAHYQETIPVSSILVRSDSGFATPELYKLCEELQNFYVVRLKSNRNLRKIAEQFVAINDQHHWDKK